MGLKIKIAVIADIHASVSPIGDRHGQYANVFLLRAVHRLNRFIKPDIVLVMGDLVNEANDPSTGLRYKSIRKMLDLLDAPYIVIPGNHDLPVSEFYQYLPAPESLTELNGFGFVAFPSDPETPGYNSRRDAYELERMSQARQHFSGPLIVLQHVSLAPVNKAPCYNYTNAEEIIDCMKRNDVFLSISGHYHEGYELYNYGSLNFISAAAICEDPFNFWIIDTDGQNISVDKQQLKIPEDYQLCDNHIHTEFAYCSENVTMESNLELGKVFGLKAVGFAEHSDQLYFDPHLWNNEDFFTRGLSDCTNVRHDMLDTYLQRAKSLGVPKERLGLEVDMDANGNLLLDSTDRDKLGFVIGAVHYLQESFKINPDYGDICKEFIWQTQKLLDNRIDILAHPFRIFRRIGMPVPKELLEPLIVMLKKYDTAVEVNFHTNNPSVDFIQKCLDANIKLTFGSDSHNSYEVGEFYPHINLLREAGYCGDFSDIILPLSMA